MGGCYSLLETVEHVESIEQFKQLVSKDITMFKAHHKHIIDDKVEYLKLRFIFRISKMKK